MKNQCLYYALDKLYDEGGYLLFRKSIHWCMPHVLHLSGENGLITHYVPPDNLKYPWHSMFGFKGFVKTGDTAPSVPMPPICMFFGTIALGVFGCFWVIRRSLSKLFS